MPTSPIATAADYADAMMSARRAKNALFLLLLLVLLGQLAIFIVLRRAPALDTSAAVSAATTQPASFDVAKLLEYLVAVTDFLGIVLAIVLSMVLLLLVKIMLVGRLIGVSKVTSAYIVCLLLIVMMFPWQSFLQSPGSPRRTDEIVNQDFKIPGVLYTWGEVTHPTIGARFDASTVSSFTILKWARYVLFPVVALFLLLLIQTRSSRGLRMALGEVEYEGTEGPPA